MSVQDPSQQIRWTVTGKDTNVNSLSYHAHTHEPKHTHSLRYCTHTEMTTHTDTHAHHTHSHTQSYNTHRYIYTHMHTQSHTSRTPKNESKFQRLPEVLEHREGRHSTEHEGLPE